MANETVIDPLSKKFEIIPVTFTVAEVELLVFEGQEEYKKAAKPTDILGGSITGIFHDAQPCFLRNTLFLVKQRTPKMTYFILKKKGF